MFSFYERYKRLLLSILGILVVIGGIFIYTTYIQKTEVDIAKKEAMEVKKMLSRHLVLPEGDEPDIRKINQKLDDPFFVNANIGDYLIIFYKSRIAYTYSPEQDRITNAGVVFMNPNQATSTAPVEKQ